MSERKYRLPHDHVNTLFRNGHAQVGINGAVIADEILCLNNQVRNLALNAANHETGIVQAVTHAADSRTAVATIAGLSTLTVLNGFDAAHQAHRYLDKQVLSTTPVIPLQESLRRKITKRAGKLAATAAVIYGVNKVAAHNPESTDAIAATSATSFALIYLQTAKYNLLERTKKPLQERRITKIKNLIKRRS